MLKAGWNAHKLNAPGKFLISAPEHDIPRRARAYLLTDEAVAAAAATARPLPSRRWTRSPAPRWPADLARHRSHASHSRLTTPATGTTTATPKPPLWGRTVRLAPDEGVSVPDLVSPDRHGPPLDLLPARRTRRRRVSHPHRTRPMARQARP